MITQRVTKGFVQKVGCRVVRTNVAASFVLHLKLCSLTTADRPFGDFCEVDEDASRLFRVSDLSRACFRADKARIANLTTRFTIERRLVNHDLNGFARRGGFDNIRHFDDREDLAFGGFGVIAKEFGYAEFISHFEPNSRIGCFARAGPRGTCFGLLLFHSSVESVGVHGAAFFTQVIRREVEREAVGVIEFERGLTR